MSKAVCEVSCWRFLAGQCSLVRSRPVEVDSDQIEKLIENNQHYKATGDGQHTQNIQISLWKSSAPVWVCVALMFGFLVSKAGGGGKNLDHISSWDSAKRHKKCSVFKTNCDGWWKVDTVWWCGMEEAAQQSSLSHREPPQRRSLHPKKSDHCNALRDWERVLWCELLLETKRLTPTGVQAPRESSWKQHDMKSGISQQKMHPHLPWG